MTFIERWTQRSGIRIRYLDNAPDEPRGLPVLFAPGVTDDADEYVALLDWFAPRRLLIVEVRGRGGSESPPDGYTVADHTADLRAVLDEEGIGRVHLMTYSRGTSWSLELALAEPERVGSLSIGDYQAVEVGMGPGFAARMAAVSFRGRRHGDRVGYHVLDGIGRTSRDRALWDRLAGLPFPIQVVHGTEPGRLVDEAAVARYRAARPDVEIVTFDGVGHDLFRHDRLAYAGAVVDFIARRAPGT